jgi:four helix bundle protein
MTIERFEDLEVWQFSRILVKEIYLLTENKYFQKDFGLASQLQRSSVSIMANIAEGFERKSKKEFMQFLYISKASCGELRSHLYILLDLNLIDKLKFNELYLSVEKISKSLSGFIKYLNQNDFK